MTAVFKTRGYRISYFKNENQSGNPYDDEVYLDDLENFEWFEMLTKKFINS
jgi:hypothetical protein